MLGGVGQSPGLTRGDSFGKAKGERVVAREGCRGEGTEA